MLKLLSYKLLNSCYIKKIYITIRYVNLDKLN